MDYFKMRPYGPKGPMGKGPATGPHPQHDQLQPGNYHEWEDLEHDDPEGYGLAHPQMPKQVAEGTHACAARVHALASRFDVPDVAVLVHTNSNATAVATPARGGASHNSDTWAIARLEVAATLVPQPVTGSGFNSQTVASLSSCLLYTSPSPRDS